MWVRDTGPGVEPAERDRIFERFARGRSGPRRSAGAGLGLAIVRAVAIGHHGRVELESHPGAGAKFTLVLPDRDSHAPDDLASGLDVAPPADATRQFDAKPEGDGTRDVDVTEEMSRWPGS